jgi:hypothetical protein
LWRIDAAAFLFAMNNIHKLSSGVLLNPPFVSEEGFESSETGDAGTARRRFSKTDRNHHHVSI